MLVRRRGARPVAGLPEDSYPEPVRGLAERLGAHEPGSRFGRRVQVTGLRLGPRLQLQRSRVDRLQLAPDAVDPFAVVLRQERQPRERACALRVRRGARRHAARKLLARNRERRPRLVEIDDHAGRQPQLISAARGREHLDRVQAGVLQEPAHLGHHPAQRRRPRARQHARPQRIRKLLAADRPVVLGRQIREHELGAAPRQGARRRRMILALDAQSAEERNRRRAHQPSIAPPSVVAKSGCRRR